MRKIILLVIAVCITVGLSNAQSKRQLNKELSEAKELLANNKCKAAKEIFSKLLQNVKKNLE